jgi:squalene cyclase
MKVFLKGAIAGIVCSIGIMGVAQQVSIPETVVKESKASIQRGVNFLTDKQGADGSWMHSPALTALSVMALQQSRATELKAIREESIEKGRQFILKFVQKDGAICTSERRYLNYSTAVCTVALALINNPKD